MNNPNPLYLILINKDNVPVATVPTNYELSAFISFEELGVAWNGEPINHFMCWSTTSQVRFRHIYDDVLMTGILCV
jgi:hypothetical protein